MIVNRIRSYRNMCSMYNLKRNWFFPISAGAFFCMNFTATKTAVIAIILAFVFSVFVAAASKPIIDYFKMNGKLTFISVISAFGISIGVMDAFTYQCLSSERFNAFFMQKHYYQTLFSIGRISCCIVSIPFVCFFLVIFWAKVSRFIQGNHEILSLSKTEMFIYPALFLLLCVYVIYAYSNSVAFYDTRKYGFLYNTIYTSDSTAHFKPSVYLWPVHEHNDLRQPLFAVFAAPFMGIPYLVSRFFSLPIQAIIINCVQIAMLTIANLLIAKAMKVKPAYRICFMLLSFCMYSNLLFSVMLEQYIVAYFWLSVVVYSVCCCTQKEDINVLAAGGTMLPSFAMALFALNEKSKRCIQSWLQYIFRIAMEFLLLLIAFCKFDIILNTLSTMRTLSGFMGKEVPFTNRFMQFTDFIRGCFIAPKASIKEYLHQNIQLTLQNHAVWALQPVTNINFLGVGILFIAFLSTVLHRKNKACIVSGGWVLISVVVLLIAGWGTAENGLILYTLYFGWAYLVLLFQFVITICEKTKLCPAVFLICAFACIAMLIYNIPEIGALLQFAFKYYPV